MQMKKILGILLAVCFVLSVTAAAASAYDGGRGHNDGPGDHHGPKFDKHHGPKFDKHHGPKFDRHHRFDGHHKRHHHPAHWEKQRVYHNHFDKHCGCYKTGYVYKMVYVAEYWSYN